MNWIGTGLIMLLLLSAFFIGMYFLLVPVNGHFYGECPDGVYQQKEWGYIDVNGAWWFARCEHGYLGPLHGNWTVTQETIESLPLTLNGNWYEWSSNCHGDLWLRLKDNVIIEAWIK